MSDDAFKIILAVIAAVSGLVGVYVGTYLKDKSDRAQKAADRAAQYHLDRREQLLNIIGLTYQIFEQATRCNSLWSQFYSLHGAQSPDAEAKRQEFFEARRQWDSLILEASISAERYGDLPHWVDSTERGLGNYVRNLLTRASDSYARGSFNNDDRTLAMNHISALGSDLKKLAAYELTLSQDVYRAGNEQVATVPLLRYLTMVSRTRSKTTLEDIGISQEAINGLIGVDQGSKEAQARAAAANLPGNAPTTPEPPPGES